MRRKRYETAEEISVPTIERRKPATGPGSLESDVLVPLAQAGISGLVLGLLVGTVAALIGARQPVLIGAAVGALVLAGVWLLLLADRRQLLWTIERVTGRDLDGDHAIGRPTREPPVTLELVDRARRQMRYLELPLSDDQVAAIARRVLRPGGMFTRQALVGVVTNDVYQALIEKLLGAGLLRTRGGGVTTGVELTPSGRAWLRRYA